MCCDDESQHYMNGAPIIIMEEFCLFNFEQFFKIRRHVPWIQDRCLILCQITNIVLSFVFFLCGLGILNQNKEAITSSCAEEWWIWSYCLMALLAPIVIGALVSIIKIGFFRLAAHAGEKSALSKLSAKNCNMFLNLGHPVGRTAVFILGVFLSSGMPPSCISFYRQTYPDLLLLFNLLVFLMFLSAFISYFVFAVAVMELRTFTPRYVITALAYLEDLTPFSFYKTHVILNTDGYTTSQYDRDSQRYAEIRDSGITEVNRIDFTIVQLALLLASALYFGWGVAVLAHDEEARSVGPCATQAWIWDFVLLALLLTPLTGILVVLLRQWRSRRKEMEAEQRAAMDLWISVLQPISATVVAVIGAVLAGNMSTYCSGIYQDAAPDLLFFFEFQVVVLCAAAILGLLVFGVGLGRRAASVYQQLLEQEDDLSGMAAQTLFEEDMRYLRSDD